MSATLLALDAASETLHLGLAVGGRRLLRALPGGARASATLLPGLLGLLDEAGIALETLDAVAVGRGPGAFTGVRAACAVAQGLAFGAGRPVLVLDTLQAVAEDARAQGAGATVWVAVDARMGETYAAPYHHDGVQWQALSVPSLRDPGALARHIVADPAQPQVAGSSLLAHPAAWAEVPAPHWPHAVPRAEALLALGELAWTRGEMLDPAQALPLYVRDKVAQTTAERAAVRVAAAALPRAQP